METWEIVVIALWHVFCVAMGWQCGGMSEEIQARAKWLFYG